MDCGFCGSTVKDGYDTCANCGAMRLPDQKKLASTSAALKLIVIYAVVTLTSSLFILANREFDLYFTFSVFTSCILFPGIVYAYVYKLNQRAANSFQWYRRP